MANFKKHRDVSIATAISLTVVLYVIEDINYIEAIIFVIIGSLSGFLPDLDHHKSIPNKTFFNITSLISGLILFVLLYRNYDLYVALFYGLLLSIFVKYILKFLYHKIIVHRGMFHSIPSALIFSILSILFLYYNTNIKLDFILNISLYIFTGYISHLILDELYSVNLHNNKVKKSFGTALKLFSFKYKLSSIFVYSLLIFSLYFLPEKDSIFNFYIGLYEKIIYITKEVLI